MPYSWASSGTAGFPNGDMALPMRGLAIALFLREERGQHRQGPEAHDHYKAAIELAYTGGHHMHSH